MKRAILRISVFLAAILVIFAGVVAFVVSTETGLRWLFQIAADSLPGKTSAGSIHGRLIGPLSISGIQHRTGAAAITIDALSMDWLPSLLLSGKFDITRLNAEGVRIVSRAKEKAPSRIELPQIRLPLNISVRSAELRDIAIIRAGASSPLVINTISLEAFTRAGTLSIRKLLVRSPAFAVDLSGKLRPSGDYPLDIQTGWSVRPGEYPPVRGRGEIGGSLSLLKVSQRITAPFEAKLDAIVKDTLSQPYWKAHLIIKDLAAREINRQWPAVRTKGEFWGSGGLAAFHLDGVFTAAEPRYGNASGKFDLSGNPDNYRISLDLELAGRKIPASRMSLYGRGDSRSLEIGAFHAMLLDGALSGSGKVSWKPVLSWNISLQGTGLNPGAMWPEWPGELSIDAATSGRMEKKKVRAVADIAGVKGILRGYPFKAAMNLGIDGNNYFLPAMELSSGQAHLAASGKLSETWAMDWKIDAPQLESLVPQSKGTLAGSGSLSGPRSNPFITANIKGENLAYKAYRIGALQANAGLDLQGREYSRLDLRAARLDVNGRHAGAFTLIGAGTASGHRLTIMLMDEGERLDARIQAAYREKIWQGTLLQSSILTRDFGGWMLENPGPFAVNIGRKEARAGQWCWSNAPSRLCLQADWRGKAGSTGSMIAKEVPLALTHMFLPDGIKVSGSFDAAVNAKYNESDIAAEATLHTSAGSLSYFHPTREPLTLAFNEISLDAHAGKGTAAAKLAVPLKGGGGFRGNVRAAYDLKSERKIKEGSNGTIVIENIPLVLFQPLLPPGMRITGALNGSADAAYTAQALNAHLSLRSSPGALSYPLAEEHRSVLAYGQASLDARMAKDLFDAALDIPLSEGGEIRGSLALPGFSPFAFSAEAQELRGTFNAETNRLDAIPVLLPQVRNTSGVFRADISFGGTLAAPAFSGAAALEQGNADIPRLGINAREIRLVLSSGNSRTAIIEGEIKSGPGSVAINGKALLSPEEGWPASIRLKGQDFEAARMPEARVYVSPDITLMIKGKSIDAAGEVGIPRAIITPHTLSSKAVPLSGDVVIENGTEKKQQKEEWKIHSEIKVSLGENVSFNGFGLVGNIRGDVTIAEEPQQLATATGELQIVNGRYTAYGQQLQIERGRILFAGGPVNNPSLDVRAIRKIGPPGAPQAAEAVETAGAVTVGANVQGSVKHPRITLFSNPTMEQSEILSYLVLGRPMQQASGEQGQVLYSAARSLSLSGGEFLAKRIGSAFGIREVHIEPGKKFEEAALVLGTHLSPRLYISYGIGLFEPIGRLRLRYELGKRLQLQVESGTQSGADLLYRYER
ncbi:MAG TPA: translocation/assembly module TamB domain-containing protein [Dissulfurispiraceae bacterium]